MGTLTLDGLRLKYNVVFTVKAAVCSFFWVQNYPKYISEKNT